MQEIHGLLSELLVSEEGLSRMQLVTVFATI
jgi:hypothetical protein